MAVDIGGPLSDSRQVFWVEPRVCGLLVLIGSHPPRAPERAVSSAA
jgi:hypothetical protein